MGGYQYSLEFKKIQVGNVQLMDLSSSIKTKVVSVVKNAVTKDTKTDEEVSMGYGKILSKVFSFGG